MKNGCDLLVLVPLLPLFQLWYVSSVSAGGPRCAALSDQNVMGFIGSLHELASCERRFYWKLSSIKVQVLEPLLELGESVGGGSAPQNHQNQNLSPLPVQTLWAPPWGRSPWGSWRC